MKGLLFSGMFCTVCGGICTGMAFDLFAGGNTPSGIAVILCATVCYLLGGKNLFTYLEGK